MNIENEGKLFLFEKAIRMFTFNCETNEEDDVFSKPLPDAAAATAATSQKTVKPIAMKRPTTAAGEEPQQPSAPIKLGGRAKRGLGRLAALASATFVL